MKGFISHMIYGAKLLSLIGLIASCKKDLVNLPSEPVITFLEIEKITNAQGIDTLLKLTIGFTDGDGNFGLDEDDIQPPFNFGGDFFYNVNVFYYYENEDLRYVPYIFDNAQFVQSFRIPRFQSKSKTDAIIGEIDVLLLPSVGGVNHKNLKLDVEIIDRDKNKSNILITDRITLNL